MFTGTGGSESAAAFGGGGGAGAGRPCTVRFVPGVAGAFAVLGAAAACAF
jgi:hypothetical protein